MFQRSSLLAVGRRCYSTANEGRNKNISSFLERMNRLYDSQNQKNPATRPAMPIQQQATSVERSQKSQKSKQHNRVHVRKPRENQSNQRDGAQPRSNLAVAGKHRSQPAIRAKVMSLSKDDDLLMGMVDSSATEKLDLYVDPSSSNKQSQPTKFVSTRRTVPRIVHGGDRAPRTSNRQQLASKDWQVKPTANVGVNRGSSSQRNQGRKRSQQKRREVAPRTPSEGVITAEAAIKLLRERIAYPNNGYAEVHNYSIKGLLPHLNPTAASQNQSMLKLLPQKAADSKASVSRAVQGQIVVTNLKPNAESFSEISLTNTLNSNSFLPRAMKIKLLHIAQGKTTVASLKKHKEMRR